MPKLRIEVDPFKLDEECAGHSSQYHEWAEALAEAQAELDRCESHLDFVKAELQQQIRESPSDYIKGEKSTESSINYAMMQQPEYTAAIRKINHAKSVVQKHKATVSALEHRKRMLTLLVDLWVQAYYAEPVSRIDKQGVRSRGRRRRQNEDNHNDND